MLPGPWVALVLAAATFRVVRLVGWDDFPPVARLRGWAVGAHLVTNGSTNARLGVTNEPLVQEWRYRRPTLEHFLGCPFCVGWWLSLGVYLLWLWQPEWTLYAAMPFALSAFVGLVAKNLDP